MSVYYMTNPSMPTKIKIGRTVNPHDRLRAANSHDTFKPPERYVFGMVVRVHDDHAAEALLHAHFADKRCVNSEFFEVTEIEVQNMFNTIGGEIMDVNEINRNVDSEERVKTRVLLKNAIKTKQYCNYTCQNPKRPGTKCHARYEQYKHSTSLDQSLWFGTFQDIVYDYQAGFLKILPEPSQLL